MPRVPNLCPSLEWRWPKEGGHIRDHFLPLDGQNRVAQGLSGQDAEFLTLGEFVWLKAMSSFWYKDHLVTPCSQRERDHY